MKVWIGGEIKHDVRDAFFAVSKSIENAVNDEFKGAKYGSGLRTWSVIPIVLPDRDHSDYPEIAKYKPKTRQCEFRLYIDHAKFKKGSTAEQYRLFCDMLRRSLGFLESWNIKNLDVQQMRVDFELAVKHLDPSGGQGNSKSTSQPVSLDVSKQKSPDRSVRVIKLYKRINRQWHYHEAWVDGATIGEHWGKVGEVGKLSRHKRDRKLTIAKNLEKVLEEATVNGFCELNAEDWQGITVEYEIEGMGTSRDLSKRQKLEEKLDDTLGKTGLGQVDGGSIGSGAMEVQCSVVNARIAKQMIKQDLTGTQFENFARISIDC